MIAGAIQIIAGVARLGGWFRAISPAVMHGMLAGIGVLICISQFHVLFDDAPKPSGVSNLLAMPVSLWRLFSESHSTIGAFAAGAITIVAMLGVGDAFGPRRCGSIPGALVGVTLSTLRRVLPEARRDARERSRVDLLEHHVAAAVGA